MKHLTLKVIGSVLALTAAMGFFSSAHAEAEKAAAKTEQQIPATAEAVWQAIDHSTVELQKIIKNGSLGDVHHLGFAIRDLVAALPERSKDLPADKLAKVKSGAKFVATLADRLDAAGDANDKAAAQANYEKLNKVLEGLRANYPKATN